MVWMENRSCSSMVGGARRLALSSADFVRPTACSCEPVPAINGGLTKGAHRTAENILVNQYFTFDAPLPVATHFSAVWTIFRASMASSRVERGWPLSKRQRLTRWSTSPAKPSS